MRIDDSHSVHWIWPMKLITIFNFSPNSWGFWKERRRDVGLRGISIFLWRTFNNNFWLSVCTVVLGSLTWPQHWFVLIFCEVSLSSYLSYLKIWKSLIFPSLEIFRSYFAFCAVDHCVLWNPAWHLLWDRSGTWSMYTGKQILTFYLLLILPTSIILLFLLRSSMIVSYRSW